MYHFKERRSSADSLSLPEIEIIPANIIKYLADFQMKGVQFLYEKRDFALLNDDSGFGKLATVVAYLAAVAVNKKTVIVYKNANRHLQGWQFHLDLLSNLKPMEVTSKEDFEDKSHNVFIVKCALLSTLRDVFKKFDVLIVDNRDELLKDKNCAAEILRVVDGKQTIIVSSMDITSCTVMVYNVLKLGRRLEPNIEAFIAFKKKYELPDTEHTTFELEDYFVKREILGRLCGDFRLRRVRNDFKDQLPLVEPKVSALNLYFWCTQPRKKLATAAKVTNVEVISPARVNNKNATLGISSQQNRVKTPERESNLNESLDEDEFMARLFVSDSEDDAEPNISSVERTEQIDDIKEDLPSEQDLAKGTNQTTGSNNGKSEGKTRKQRKNPANKENVMQEKRLTRSKSIKTEIIVPDENDSDVVFVSTSAEPTPVVPKVADKQVPPVPDQPKRRRGRPLKKLIPEPRTFTRTRAMDRMTRSSSDKNKYMSMETSLNTDRKKRLNIVPAQKAPRQIPEKRTFTRTRGMDRMTRASSGKSKYMSMAVSLDSDRKKRRKTIATTTLKRVPSPPPPLPQVQKLTQSLQAKSSQLSIISTSDYEDIQCGQRLTAESNSDNSVQLTFPPPSPIFSTPPALSSLYNNQEVIVLTDSSQSSEQSRRTKIFKKQHVAQPAPQKASNFGEIMRGSPDLFSSSDFSGEKSILNVVQKCMHCNNNNDKPELSETPSVIEALSPTPPQSKSPHRTNNNNKITRYLIPSPGPGKTPAEADNKNRTEARKSPKSPQNTGTVLTRWLHYDMQNNGPTTSTGDQKSTSPESKVERRKRAIKRRRFTLM